jgi:replicative superfamily II helicase
MFLSDLGPLAQQAFLSLARNVVAADDRVTVEEEALLRDLHREIGEETALAPRRKNIAEICADVTDRRTQILILLELASVAHVDGEYEPREQALIEKISDLWSIDTIDRVRAEEWGKRRVELMTDALDIMLDASS